MPATVSLHQGHICLSADALAVCMGIPKEAADNTVWKGLSRNKLGETSHWQSFPTHSTGAAASSWCRRCRSSRASGRSTTTAIFISAGRKDWISEQAPLLVEAGDVAAAQALGLGLRKAERAAISAGWARAILAWDFRAVYPVRDVAYQVVVDLLGPLKLYGLTVSHPRSLARKLIAFADQALSALVPASVGNSNAAVDAETSAWQREFLGVQYAQPIKPTLAQVTKLYNEEAKRRRLKTYTKERVRQILHEPATKLLWAEARHGRQAARALTETHVRQRRPERPDRMWGIDGTTVQLYSQDGRALKKEWYMVVVTDAYTDAIIGVAIDRTEVAQVVLSAFYAATQYAGYVPDFVEYDGGAANRGKEMQEALVRIGAHGIQGQAYNGKGQHTERVIGWLERGFLRGLPNFVGGNVTTRSLQSKANPDHLAYLLKDGKLPEARAISGQLRAAIVTYNHTGPHDVATPHARYMAQGHDGRRTLDEQTKADLFWTLRTGQDAHGYTYGPRGIVMEVRHRRYYFEVESAPGVQDADWYEHNIGTRFYLRYDPTQAEPLAIHLYDRVTGEWCARAVRKHEFAMVPGDMREGERALLSERLDDRKAMLERAKVRLAVAKTNLAEQGIPEAGFQHLHKDALNRAEGRAEMDLLLAGASFEAPAPRPPAEDTTRRSPGSPMRIDHDLVARILEADDEDDY